MRKAEAYNACKQDGAMLRVCQLERGLHPFFVNWWCVVSFKTLTRTATLRENSSATVRSNDSIAAFEDEGYLIQADILACRAPTHWKGCSNKTFSVDTTLYLLLFNPYRMSLVPW